MTQESERDALVERLLGAFVGAGDLLHVYLGDRLGLYDALVDGGPLSAPELAERAGVNERYAREWLQQQAVAGILEASGAEDDEDDLRFTLPAGHAEVLTDRESLAYFAPTGLALVGIANAMPELTEAFRTGAGVPYEAYGRDTRDFISRINRPMFLKLLATEWFPRVNGLAERLRADPPAKVADVGCGTGWSSIAIARGFPKATVVGLDLDEASIADAKTNAAASGVADRVSFEVRDAADPGLKEQFDLVCGFETVHDMCDPVAALRTMRGLRTGEGTVLVADERVADSFTTDVEDGERFQWSFSTVHCLPCALTDPPATGTGTIMRTPTFRRYAEEAGFSHVEVLPIENDFWRFYRLVG